MGVIGLGQPSSTQRADGLIGRLARGAASAFVINAFGVGFAFLAQLVAARLLGFESYGVFAWVAAWVLVLASFATLGYEMSLLRFAATYADRGDVARLTGVAHAAETETLLAGGGIAALGLLALGVAGSSMSPELHTTAALGLVTVPLLALMRVRVVLVRSFGHVAWALLPDKVAREGLFVLAIGALWLVWPGALQAPSAGGAALFGTAGGLLLVSYWTTRLAPPGYRQVPRASDEKTTWRRTTWPLWLLTLSQLAMKRVEVLLLGWLIGTSAAGAFFACFVAAQIVLFPLVAVNILLSPTIARLHAKGDMAELQRVVTITSWWTAAGAVLFAIPAVIIAPYILSLFGSEFADYAGVMRVLILGQLVNAAAGAIVPLLSLTGGERHAFSISLASLGGKVILLLILIPIFGIVGAAVVEPLFRAGWNIAMGVAIWSRLGIVPSILNSFRLRRSAAAPLT